MQSNWRNRIRGGGTTMLMHQPIPQLTSIPRPGSPALSPRLHVAIISDGNGRWATSRGLPRSAGHRAGAETVRRVVAAAPRLGISTLTLYALSSANWNRPPAEVQAILRLLHEYLLTETTNCVNEGVRLTILGRRDRIPPTLREAIKDAEAATANGTRLHLRLAVDYSARESIGTVLAEVSRGSAPDVDLLIRTGGEQRLSDFLLWECAYAELLFIEKRWPDFDAADLEAALQEFWRRERTHGALPSAAAD